MVNVRGLWLGYLSGMWIVWVGGECGRGVWVMGVGVDGVCVGVVGVFGCR